MPIDYRLDPFQDVLNPVTITGETHIIPSVSPFTIRLGEVPLKETPSSISLTIGGVEAEEVSSAPAAGQFWPDYSTGADGDDDWNTGTILFNAADAGKTVVVTYKGTGTVVWADLVNTYVFTESGTITAPSWATHAIISGCAGGGGGGSGSTSSSSTGSTGGTTSFGSLLTLGGGLGGIGGGGAGGAKGSGIFMTVPAEGGLPEGSTTGYRGGEGGGGPFGRGGARKAVGSTSTGNAATGYGGGGGGGIYGSYGGGGGGGAGGACVNWPVAVVGGTTYTITIGAGGNGATSVGNGGKGSPGYMQIRWVRM